MTSSLSTRARTARALAGRLLDSTEVHRLDELVASAARTLGVSIASLSMLSDRQIIVSTFGADGLSVPRGTELPFEDTLCVTVAQADRTVAIDDTRHDARVSAVPLVRAGKVGAYLGSPLHLNDAVMGVLCVVDPEPRHWDAKDIQTLDAIADRVLHAVIELADPRPDNAARPLSA